MYQDLTAEEVKEQEHAQHVKNILNALDIEGTTAEVLEHTYFNQAVRIRRIKY